MEPREPAVFIEEQHECTFGIDLVDHLVFALVGRRAQQTRIDRLVETMVRFVR